MLAYRISVQLNKVPFAFIYLSSFTLQNWKSAKTKRTKKKTRQRVYNRNYRCFHRQETGRNKKQQKETSQYAGVTWSIQQPQQQQQKANNKQNCHSHPYKIFIQRGERSAEWIKLLILLCHYIQTHSENKRE